MTQIRTFDTLCSSISLLIANKCVASSGAFLQPLSEMSLSTKATDIGGYEEVYGDGDTLPRITLRFLLNSFMHSMPQFHSHIVKAFLKTRSFGHHLHTHK